MAAFVAVTGRKRTLGGVIDIQAAITIKTASSCGSEIYCACIHKGTQKIWSDFNKAF